MSALGDAALSVAVGLAFCVSIENAEDALSAVMPKRPFYIPKATPVLSSVGEYKT